MTYKKKFKINNHQVVVASSSFILVLYLMVFLRPIFIFWFPFDIGGLRVPEVFAIVISAGLLIVTIANFRNIRIYPISLMILFYCFYCVLSIAWGSHTKEVTRAILPFITFFAVQSLVVNKGQMKSVLTFLIIGYAIFIIVNFVVVALFKGGSINLVYQTDLTRYGGLTLGSHSLAHSMFIFTIVYFYYKTQITDPSRFIKILSLILLIMSYYCIMKTYTRTVYVGLFLFWLIYLLGTNRKYFLFFIILTAIGFSIYQARLDTIFWDVTTSIEKSKIESAGSGRIGIWEDSIKFFSSLNPEERILGVGLGYENESSYTHRFFSVGTSHSDYVGLLVTTGIIGITLYFIIVITLIISILLSSADKKLKFIMLAFIVSILAMNMLSNSYISRVELAQLFWLFVGLFYAQRDHLESIPISVSASIQ